MQCPGCHAENSIPRRRLRNGTKRWRSGREPSADGCVKPRHAPTPSGSSWRFGTRRTSSRVKRPDVRIARRAASGRISDPEPESSGRRHSVLKCEQKIFVDFLGFFAGLIE